MSTERGYKAWAYSYTSTTYSSSNMLAWKGRSPPELFGNQAKTSIFSMLNTIVPGHSQLCSRLKVKPKKRRLVCVGLAMVFLGV